MAGNLTSISSGGISAGTQTVTKSGSERKADKQIADIGKALQENDTASAQQAVAALKTAAPTQNAGTQFGNAVKALDQALKSGDAKGATDAFQTLQRARLESQNQQRTQEQFRPTPVQRNERREATREVVQARRQEADDQAVLKAAAQEPKQSESEAASLRAAAETQLLQRADSKRVEKQVAERDFITRSDLNSKAAKIEPAKKPAGSTIDTTA